MGSTLTCRRGAFTGHPTRFTLEWLRGQLPVHLGVRYRIARADRGQHLSCAVTARNAAGGTLTSSRAVRAAMTRPDHRPRRPENPMNGLHLIKRAALIAALGALPPPAGAGASGIVLGSEPEPRRRGHPARASAWMGTAPPTSRGSGRTAAPCCTARFRPVPTGCSPAITLPVISRAPDESVSTLRIFQDANDQPLIVLGLCCGPTGEEVLKRDAGGSAFQSDLLGVDTEETLDPAKQLSAGPPEPRRVRREPTGLPAGR